MSLAAAYPKVSVIVPVKNGAQEIGACVARLQAQRYPPHALELIVVDNGSTDATAAICERAGVTVVYEVTPGPAAARNAGAARATGELLLFTDADCLADEEWVIRHATAHLRLQATHPEVQIVGGGILGVNRSFWALCDDLCSWSQQHPALPARELPRFAPTANLSVTRTAFDRIRGFDEELFSGEDSAFCAAARKLGIKLRFEPSAMVGHVNRTSFRDFARHPSQWARLHAKLFESGVLNSAATSRPLRTVLQLPWLRRLLVLPMVAIETTMIVRRSLQVGRLSCIPLVPFLVANRLAFALGYVESLIRSYDAQRAGHHRLGSAKAAGTSPG